MIIIIYEKIYNWVYYFFWKKYLKLKYIYILKKLNLNKLVFDDICRNYTKILRWHTYATKLKSNKIIKLSNKYSSTYLLASNCFYSNF